MICHHTIVQNPHNLLSPTDHLVQHWLQPGLIPRDVSRGSRLETIVYMGGSINSDPLAEALHKSLPACD